MRYWLAVLAVVTLSRISVSAVEIGSSIPDLKLTYLLNGPLDFKIDATGDEDGSAQRFLLLDFFGSYWPSSREVTGVLNELAKTYAARGLRVVAVSGEAPDTLQEFIEKQSGLQIVVANDPDDFTAKQIIPANMLLPVCAIVNGRGRLIWLGSAVELPDTLKQIYDGSYREENRRKILPLYNELGVALRSGSAGEVTRITEQMLDLEAANATAAEARLFIHETNGETEKAWNFLQRRLGKAPTLPLWYLLSVSFGARNPQYADAAIGLAAQYLARVKPLQAGDSIAMAWELVMGYPFHQGALDTAEKLLDSVSEPTWRERAARALLAYRRCRRADALRFQLEAIDLASALGVNPAQLEDLKRIAAFFTALPVQ